ncbi:hypothetical protein QA612_12930 [Evansella sp. AB-P1]|uniref:hypothetical protein n=1 Tax=Evansella sp. AB-P1 TaxID=3037653 RepID=UPI00241C427C|nr:hypothetical protein [Evansella sp. AB-P1]MDG5788386.1 hypothetical protein [Evansella sp. AB-P1]
MAIKRNMIGTIILWIGIIFMVILFLIGIYSGNAASHFGMAWPVTLTWWGYGFVIGMLIIGFSEVIELLNRIWLAQPKGELMENHQVLGSNSEKINPKDVIIDKLGGHTANRIYELYGMQGKVIEEVIITPYKNKMIVKARLEGDDQSTYDVVNTAGNDAINSPLNKDPELEAWFNNQDK